MYSVGTCVVECSRVISVSWSGLKDGELRWEYPKDTCTKYLFSTFYSVHRVYMCTYVTCVIGFVGTH